MQPWQDRLLRERNQLWLDTHKLKDFIASDEYEKLAIEDKELLQWQLVHMQDYGRVLNLRVMRIYKSLEEKRNGANL